MIENIFRYVCDSCFRKVVADTMVLPYYWTHGTYQSGISTAHGYTVSRAYQGHFCSDACKDWWEKLHPEWKKVGSTLMVD